MSVRPPVWPADLDDPASAYIRRPAASAQGALLRDFEERARKVVYDRTPVHVWIAVASHLISRVEWGVGAVSYQFEEPNGVFGIRPDGRRG